MLMGLKPLSCLTTHRHPVSAWACFNLWHYSLSDTGIDIRFCGILVKSIAKPYLSQCLGAASDWRLVRLRLSLMRDPVSSIK